MKLRTAKQWRKRGCRVKHECTNFPLTKVQGNSFYSKAQTFKQEASIPPVRISPSIVLPGIGSICVYANCLTPYPVEVMGYKIDNEGINITVKSLVSNDLDTVLLGDLIIA